MKFEHYKEKKSKDNNNDRYLPSPLSPNLPWSCLAQL